MIILSKTYLRHLLFLSFVFLAQPNWAGTKQTPVTSASSSSQTLSSAPGQSTYELGVDDSLIFQGPIAEEIVNKPFRIGPDGEISLPMVGRVQAAGLTIKQFEAELNKRLAAFYKDPEIVVDVAEFRSQPVSVLGAVNQPGTHQLQGRKTLLEIISLAGGFRNDAGQAVTITRDLEWGALPLPNAKIDVTGRFSVGELSVQQLLEANDPQVNIPIMPRDVISVLPAQMVYVIGDVKRAGGFVLGQRDSISVLQALALAEGVTSTADSKHARIIHRNPNRAPTDTAINLKGLFHGERQDPELQGGDVLFIPASTGKKAGFRTAETLLQTASGMAIWHF